jgi:TonB family protein
MKSIFLSLLSCILLSGCFPQYQSYNKRPAVDHSAKYAEKLEPGSVLVSADFLSTVERTTDGKYIRKEFFPDTKQIIQFQTYPDKALSVLDGPYKSWWDDGILVSEGTYTNGKRNGDWTNWSGKTANKGKYVNDKPEGIWVEIDSMGNKRNETSFTTGKRNGPFKEWNGKGELVREGSYLNDEINTEKVYLKEDNDKNIFQVVEVIPRFPGCDTGTKEELKKCAETKLLQFIYSNIKYPPLARENGIQGTAYVRFVVDKDGSIINIKTIRGITAEIRDECERVIRMMPKWVPGQQGGKPVKVMFNIPIKFKLE